MTTLSINEFLDLLAVLNTGTNEERTNREKVLESIDCKVRLSLYLQAFFLPEVSEENRILAAMLARRLILHQSEQCYDLFSINDKNQIKSELLNRLKIETSKDIRLRYADLICALAEKEIDSRSEFFEQANGNGAGPPIVWPELMEFIVSSGNMEGSGSYHRYSALYIFQNLPSLFVSDEDETAKKEHIQLFGTIILRGFTDPDYENQVIASKCLSSLLETYGEQAGFNQALKDLIPPLFQLINQEIMKGNDQILSVLVEICENSGDYLRPYFSQFLEFCLMVVNNNDIESEIKNLTLECFVSLAEKLPAAMRKHGTRYIKPLCEIMLKMMTDLDDDLATWSQTDDEDDDDDQSNAISGEKYLDRLACALKGKIVFETITEIVPRLLKSSNWKDRHAGIMAINSCAEGCHKQMQSVLKSILDTIVPFVQDSHPRVRYAICNAFGQLSTDFPNHVQKNFHDKIVPGLLLILDDATNPRVQSHAAAALVNFSEECPSNILSIYLDTLINKLHCILQNRFENIANKMDRMVLEQIVVTVSSLADAVEEKFEPYYDRFVPGLKWLIKNSVQDDLKTLRGKTIECITFIASAVGKERFMPDSKEIIELLLQVQGEGLADDDPQNTYMVVAWARICTLLENDFQPYLPSVMGPVMKLASSRAEFSLDEVDDNDSDEWATLKISNNQELAINTSIIEDKATACKLLVCYAKSMKQGFLPYVRDVTTLMTSLSNFFFNDSIRSSVAEIFPQLLEVAQCSNEPCLIIELWEKIKKSLLSVLDSEVEREVLAEFLLSAAECIKIIGTSALTLEEFKILGTIMKNIFQYHFTKHAERVAARNAEDYDEDEEARLENEKEDDDYVLTRMTDLVESLFKVHGPSILSFFEEYIVPNLLILIQPYRPNSDLAWSSGIFIVLLENLPPEHEAAERYRPKIQEIFEKCVDFPDCDIKRNGCFAVGVAALTKNQNYTQWVTAMVPKLLEIIDTTLQKETNGTLSVLNLDEENGSMFENAVSAICKVMIHMPVALAPHNITVDSLIPKLIQWLPIRWDEAEVPAVYDFVCGLLRNNHPVLMSAPMQTLPHIVKCFIISMTNDVLIPKQPIYFEIVNLLKNIQQNGDLFKACLENLSADEKKVLERCLTTEQIPKS